MGSSITAIILSAGANARLKDIVPPGLKPLLLINGRPLIQHALDHAHGWGADEFVFVVGPHNAAAITAVLPEEHHFVLQPRPIGVCDAIRRALLQVHTPHTLILCADNTFSGMVPLEIGAHDQFIAIRRDVREDRFMRVAEDQATGTASVVYNHEPATAVWIGPLFIITERLREHIWRDDIVDLLQRVGPFTPLEMMCSDLGIPEVL